MKGKWDHIVVMIFFFFFRQCTFASNSTPNRPLAFDMD